MTVIINETQLVEEVEEFFNEVDTSVGMGGTYAFCKETVNEFEEAFNGISVTTYTKDCLYFTIQQQHYQVIWNVKKQGWQLIRMVIL